MDNAFLRETMPLVDFCRMPVGSTAMYFCRYDKLALAMNRITGKFTIHKGKCTLKSYLVIDPSSGHSFRMIDATVLKSCPPRKKRGRPKGVKNKPKEVSKNG